MSRSAFILCCAMMCCVGMCVAQAQSHRISSPGRRLPGVIVANEGQWRREVLFGDMLGRFAFTRDGATLARPDVSPPLAAASITDLARLANALFVEYRFVNPSPRMEVRGGAATGGVGHVYAGRDSANWRSGMPIRAGVVYVNVWDSVDAEFREERGRLALTLRLRPGAHPGDVRLRSSDGDDMTIADDRRSRAEPPAFSSTGRGAMTLDDSTWYGDSLAYNAEFSTYFPVKPEHLIEGVRTHTDGSLFITGMTYGRHYNLTDKQQIMYAIHLDCDGRTVLYTTIYHADDGWSFDWSRDHAMCLGRNGNIVVSGTGNLALSHIPLTPNALELTADTRSAPSAFFFELDPSGALHYASLFGTRTDDMTESIISSMAFDSHENLCMFGGYKPHGFKYLTPGTVDATNRNSGSYVVKLCPSLDTVIWGTRVGGVLGYGGSGFYGAIAVDSADNVIVAGLCSTSKDSIHLVNAAFPNHDWRGYSRYLQKLSPDAGRYIFSTYMPGDYSDEYSSTHIGRANSIHIFHEMDSIRGPVVNATRGYSGAHDGYYMHFSPEGTVQQAFYLGGAWHDGIEDMDMDRLGNMYFLGWTSSPDFPFVRPLVPFRMSEAANTVLTVIKAGTDSILFSTPWLLSDWSYGHYNWGDDEVLNVRPSGYVSFAGEEWYGLPVFNALRDYSMFPDSSIHYGSHWEGYITRLFLPFAGQDFMECRVTGTDSLSFETRHRIIDGTRFSIRVSISNPSPVSTAFKPDVVLRLPPGVVLDPPGQSLTPTLHDPFLPGDTASFTVTVRVDTIREVDSLFAFRAFVGYDLEPDPPTCERPFVRGAHYAPIRRFMYPVSTYSCTLESPDSLMPAIGDNSLAGNPFNVRCRIFNTGAFPLTLSGVRLELPTGLSPWLTFVAAGDSLQPGGTIAVGGELVRDWPVRAACLPTAHEAAMRVTVIDSFGVREPACAHAIRLPGLLGLECAIAGHDVVHFDAANGGYSPSPIVMNLDLTNRLDTLLSGVAARIDLAGAPHLRLAAGETATKSSPVVAAHGATRTGWQVEVVPHPAAEVVDTIVVWYGRPDWTRERSCTHLLRIVPPTSTASCALVAPTVDVAANGDYLPDTVSVTWTLTNGGQTTTPAGVARLTAACDTGWVLDPLVRAVPAVGPNQTHVITWRLKPKNSAFSRSIALAVTARDSADNEIAGCQTTLDLPRVSPVVECMLRGEDTIHYQRSADAYAPDPSDLTLTAISRVDTVLMVTADLDLSSAPHLALAAGETGARALGALAPRATANAVFRVTVEPRPETNVTDMPNAITTAHYDETADEAGCSTLTVIEGREKIYAAACFTAGHDTSWADVGNEDIIPHPLQMRLGIVNTGNETLDSVTAAIVLPAGYILTRPPDSIQSYPAIAPGDTGRREWLMEVNREHPVEGAGTVRWTWGNARTSGECTREAALLQGSPQGIALSRWRLDFRAERGKALPAAESVDIWTGNNNPYQWASASADGWIDASPGILTGKGTITIQPNTTALPEGFYEGTVAIVTSEFARPTPIEVGYEIYTLASAPAPPAPATPTLTCSPNPVRAGGVLEVRYSRSGVVRLRLLDALGREAIPAATTPQTARTSLALPANLAAGLYFVEVTSREGRAVRGVAVVP